MSDPAPPVRPVPRRQDGGLFGRWFASEWGLRVLALVLAILIWAVIWNDILDEQRISARVRVETRTPTRFVAFPEGQVELLLKGPQGELERARAVLGADPSVSVTVDDAKGDFQRIGRVDGEAFHFGFSRRLVQSISPLAVEVYRWKEQAVRVLAPEVLGVPDGYGYEVTLDPEVLQLRVPATTVGDTLQPDAIDLSSAFQGEGPPVVPPPQVRDLGFGAWRNDPEKGRYRTVVELPGVKATVTFFAKDVRKVRNRIEFRIRDGWTVRVSQSDLTLSQGSYEGRFVGASRDLDALERQKDAWWFVVRIPDDKLPTDEEVKRDDSFKVELLHVADLDELRVSFEPAPEDRRVLVEIVRAE